MDPNGENTGLPVPTRNSSTRKGSMRASRVSLHGRKCGWRQQLAADVLDELAILLRLGDHRDPFGIGEKSAPALLALGHVVPGEHVGDLLAALADQRGPNPAWRMPCFSQIRSVSFSNRDSNAGLRPGTQQ